MLPTDIDPSLRTTEPLLESLDDGFSPPPTSGAEPERGGERAAAAEEALGTKSPF